MNKWTVILSNGEEVEEKNFGSWRELKEKCDLEKLSIKHLYYGEELLEPRIMGQPPEFVFIIQDGLAIYNGPTATTDFRRGIGCMNISMNRYKIDWRGSSQKNRNYREARKYIPSFYKEVAIKYDSGV